MEAKRETSASSRMGDFKPGDGARRHVRVGSKKQKVETRLPSSVLPLEADIP